MDVPFAVTKASCKLATEMCPRVWRIHCSGHVLWCIPAWVFFKPSLDVLCFYYLQPMLDELDEVGISVIIFLQLNNVKKPK
eukprot:7773111-Ditylum_brightwellii.AAC.1